ncbi:hypothetical protein EVA_12054 [gut metagenome]|uniref:Uncharacterized protein n=1 Tax=gut metagenome TaxID=749906 RepID=J9FXY3_9ZZZZ
MIVVFGSCISLVQVSAAARIIGTVEDERVGKIAVVPCNKCA